MIASGMVATDDVLIDVTQDELLDLLTAEEPLGSLQAPVRASTAAPPAVAERIVHSAADFVHEFELRFRGREPVILRGLAAAWPAAAQWADVEYFSSRLGDQDVDVLTPREPGSKRFLKAECNVERRPFTEVVRQIVACTGQTDEQRRSSSAKLAAADLASPDSCASCVDGPCHSPSRRLYARAPLSCGLAADVDLADLSVLLPTSRPHGLPLLKGGDSNLPERDGAPHHRDGSAAPAPQFKLSNCGVWVGSAGNLTPLHYDLCHGLLVGVIGKKMVSYFGGAAYSDQDEVDYSRCMYRRDDAPELSNVDFDAWRCGAGVPAGDAERRRHPRFSRAVHRLVELRPGDVLYTPPFCWHHVETTADGPAVSVLVPFDQTQEEASASLLASHYS
jgi:hypothetical protein